MTIFLTKDRLSLLTIQKVKVKSMIILNWKCGRKVLKWCPVVSIIHQFSSLKPLITQTGVYQSLKLDWRVTE